MTRAIKRRTGLLFTIVFLSPFLSFASKKKNVFFEDGLSQESVLPLFDSKKVVRSRSILLKNKVEIALTFSNNLSETFFNSFQYGGGFTYYFNEEFGLGFSFLKYLPGISADGEAIGKEARNINFENVPDPLDITLAHLQWNLYYGKMSLSKSTVINTHLYTLSGLCLYRIREQNSIGVDVGIGQKFYLSKTISLRSDFIALVFSGPDVFSTRSDMPQPISNFETKTYIHFLFSLGLSFLTD